MTVVDCVAPAVDRRKGGVRIRRSSRSTLWTRTFVTLFSIPLFVLAFVACGEDDDDEDGGTASAEQDQAPQEQESGGEEGDLPTEFEGEFYRLVEQDGLPEGASIDAEGMMLMDSLMTSADGTAALLWLALTAPPPEEADGGSASIECGGKTVEGALVQDAPGGSGLLRLQDMGAASLKIESNRAIFADAESPPLCTEHRGTWHGAYGPLEGKSGTFITYGTHDRDRETFEAFLELTEV